MVLTPSTMLPLGTPLPAFSLERAENGVPWSSAQLDGRPVLVLFLCAHCPFVKHIEPEISRLARDLGQRIQIVALCSNSSLSHPQDGPEGMGEQARRNGWTFPYLFDASQAVARAFQAACTPDLFLFSGWGDESDSAGDSAADGSRGHRLVYRGQLDGSRPGNDLPLDGRDLRAAIDALLAGRAIDADQKPSIGCNIKWHPAG